MCGIPGSTVRVSDGVNLSSPSDPVSVVGRLWAARRGYIDAGSVQARAKREFPAVAHQSAVHRHEVDGAMKIAKRKWGLLD